MVDSLIEVIIAAAETRLTAMVDQDAVRLFDKVERGWPFSPGAEIGKRKVNLFPLVERPIRVGQTLEKVKERLVLGMFVKGKASTQPALDKELNEVVSLMKVEFENKSIGGVTWPATCNGWDTSEFAQIPVGGRLLAVIVDYAYQRGNPYPGGS